MKSTANSYVIGALQGTRVISRHATEALAKKSLSKARKKDPNAAVFSAEEWKQAMEQRRNGAATKAAEAKAEPPTEPQKLKATAKLTELATVPVEAIPEEPKVEAPPQATSHKRPASTVKVVDDTPIPGSKLPEKSPFPGKHNAAIYNLFRSSKTVGQFRKDLKQQGLYKGIQDCHFTLKLYAMARNAS